MINTLSVVGKCPFVTTSPLAKQQLWPSNTVANSTQCPLREQTGDCRESRESRTLGGLFMFDPFVRNANFFGLLARGTLKLCTW